MVTIEKDGRTLTVTKGAFNKIYKSAGYVIVGAEEDRQVPSASGNEITYTDHKNVREESSESVEDDSDDDEDDAFDEKPLSEMTFRELKSYADSIGLDHSDYTTKRDLRNAIIEFEGD